MSSKKPRDTAHALKINHGNTWARTLDPFFVRRLDFCEYELRRKWSKNGEPEGYCSQTRLGTVNKAARRAW
jgi:hypothetical protein